VTPVKGHDLLIDALAAIVDVPWSCRCVGSLDRDRDFAAGIHRRIADAGLAGRVQLVGPVGEAELERIYAAADLLVLPSRAETYGMVITEGLAHGLPAVAADVGGVAEALSGSNGDRPGLLVPPGDAAGLATALRAWLADVRLREQLRRAARERRTSLCGWPATASMIAGVAAKVSA
jgi:glycosyltransferase involved in cell wall biosynthesis